MTTKQLGILNALVTFAAENVPGGLAEDEQEVARIVGAAALAETKKTHDYKIVNSTTFGSMEETANFWAERGWKVVAVISDTRSGYAHQLTLERPVDVSHPDD